MARRAILCPQTRTLTIGSGRPRALAPTSGGMLLILRASPVVVSSRAPVGAVSLMWAIGEHESVLMSVLLPLHRPAVDVVVLRRSTLRPAHQQLQIARGKLDVHAPDRCGLKEAEMVRVPRRGASLGLWKEDGADLGASGALLGRRRGRRRSYAPPR